jgi:glutathione S-transferase
MHPSSDAALAKPAGSGNAQRAGLTLIGQYDSPFVRRVAIALVHYQVSYEHWPWSVWADAERLATYNPLRRVPVLVLADGTCLFESYSILDYLDELAPPASLLLPRTGTERQTGLRVCALATGIADKAVVLLYEHVLREPAARNARWAERCAAQIKDTLLLLDAERAQRPNAFWFGEALSHADIALACALRFTREAHAALFESLSVPALRAHAARCEALPQFQQVVQPLKVQLEPPP